MGDRLVGVALEGGLASEPAVAETGTGCGVGVHGSEGGRAGMLSLRGCRGGGDVRGETREGMRVETVDMVSKEAPGLDSNS